MSDYETKQAESLLPSRNEYENVTAQKIKQIQDVVAQLKSGYPSGGGQGAGGPPKIVIPYGASPTMEPGADPGVTPEAVEAEMRRRGLLQ